MRNLTADLRYAVRSLRKSPGYTALCIAALALGVGANGAIFSLVEAMMLRGLPYAQPERLVMPHMSVSGGPETIGLERMPWSYPKLELLRREQKVFTDVAGFVPDSVNLAGTATPERLQLEMVSPSYFDVLGLQAARGRTFTAGDGRPDAPVVALIGDGLWQRRFGGDPAVLGRTVSLNKVPATIVGVAPRHFAGLSGDADIWLPATAAARLWYPEALSEVNNHYLEAVARLRPGVGPQLLAAEMSRLGKVVDRTFPVPPESSDGSLWGAGAVPLAEARRDPFVRRALVVLLAAVGAVLLIACANLASLSLVRASRRRRELAIRVAIGASGGRLLRQSLLESLLLGFGGVVMGLVAAALLVRGLTAMRPEAFGTWGVSSSELADLAGAGLGAPVVGFCAAVGLATALLFGLAPALAARRVGPAAGLRQGGSALAGRRGFGRGPLGGARSLLVAVQVALALVTLSGAGLLLRSLWALQAVDLGFRPQQVLTFRVSPSQGDYRGAGEAVAFHRTLLERLGGLPGVDTAALGSCLPATGAAGCNSTIVFSVDAREIPRDAAPSIGWHLVSDDYFRTLGIRLHGGRTFDGRDRDGAQRTLVLNETAARRLFPGGDAVGHRLQIGTMGLNGEVHAEVIGVVADARYRQLEQPAVPEAYIPDAQAGLIGTTVFLRTAGDPLAVVPAVRAAMRGIDASLPIYRVRTLEEQLGFALSKARFGSLLLLAFAGLALALAAIGVYGILAQTVSARRGEIGLRMALGAAAGQVERLMLRQGMALAVAGALTGVALSLALTGALRGLLFGVTPRDPWTLAVVTGLLLLVALVACAGPARRAARVEPTLLLRQE